MRYLVFIFALIPLMLQAQEKDQWLHHVIVFPDRNELEFLNKVQDSLNEIVISHPGGFPVYVPWFSYEAYDKEYLKSRIIEAVPDSSYLITFISDIDFKQFSLVNISRNYQPTSPNTNGYLVFPSQTGIERIDTLYDLRPPASPFPLYQVELVEFANFLSQDIFDSIVNLSYSLLIHKLATSTCSQPVTDSSFIAKINLKSVCLSYPGLDFLNEVRSVCINQEVKSYRSVFDTLPSSSALVMEVFFLNYDTIFIDNPDLPYTLSPEINKPENIQFYLKIRMNETHLKYQNLRSAICFSLNYNLIGFEYKLRIPSMSTYRSIWLMKQDLFHKMKNKYFESYVNLIYYGYFYQLFGTGH